MPHQPTGPTHRLRRVVQRFIDKAETIRLLALRDRSFRELCEDLELALDALERFETRSDSAHREEIAEYCTLISELEAEVAAAIEAGRPEGP
jgi:hypothetical protein